VPARVPLDVDLEDRLIYGLTPQRFGYAALALLTAMAAWHSLPGLLGQVAAVAAGLLGAALAWGRFGGRGFDAWLWSSLRYLLRNYRLEFDAAAFRRLLAWPGARRRPRLRLAPRPRRPPAEWTPRRLRAPLPTPSLRVVGSWEADP